MTLTDIESELSYAYLHAVASHAQMACSCTGRIMDNEGIDAKICATGPFETGALLSDVEIDIQLKATTAEPITVGDYFSYSFRNIGSYNKLRVATTVRQRLLVVLFLPKNHADWITHDSAKLALKNCAYWVSLRNAPETDNSTSTTVYLPKTQVFSTVQLKTLVTGISRTSTLVDYQRP